MKLYVPCHGIHHNMALQHAPVTLHSLQIAILMASLAHATSTQSADTKVMQVNAVQATSQLFDTDSETIAPQVSAVTAAAEDLPAETRQRDISGFVMLLQGQLHPDADLRITAAQMRKMPWVKSARDEALPKCPTSF